MIKNPHLAAIDQFSRENRAYNKAWFADLREHVAAGEPLAYLHISAPLEIFRAMGIHVVVSQWWASVVGAQGKTKRYRDILVDRGYRADLCSYCSNGLSSLLETDPAEAPWGGLPRPTVLVSGKTCSNVNKIFDLFSDELGIPHFSMEMGSSRPSLSAHVGELAGHWDRHYDPLQLDLYVAQSRELITFLEEHTGRKFDIDRFREVMELADEQQDYYRKTRQLILDAQKTPLNITEQLVATVIPQWHRGTEWARDRARSFYEMTRDLVGAGVGACENERARLMWIGIGLWHNLAFYQSLADEFGAVFAWNEYLALGADGYGVKMSDDLLRTQAARVTNALTVVAQDSWYLQQALAGQFDGVVIMTGGGGAAEGAVCSKFFGRKFRTEQGLRDAGIPVCAIEADPVSKSGFDEEAIKARIADFLRDEVAPWRAAGRPLRHSNGTW